MFPDLSTQTWVLLLGGVGVFFLLSLYSIWDAFHREFETVAEKMIWIQAAIMIPFLGAIAYLFMGRKRGQPLPYKITDKDWGKKS